MPENNFNKTALKIKWRKTMSCDFWIQKKSKAREEHFCAGCRQKIEVGEEFLRLAGKNRGSFFSCKYHTECHEEEINIQKEFDLNDDEYMSLADIVYEYGLDEYSSCFSERVLKRLTALTKNDGDNNREGIKS